MPTKSIKFNIETTEDIFENFNIPRISKGDMFLVFIWNTIEYEECQTFLNSNPNANRQIPDIYNVSAKNIV